MCEVYSFIILFITTEYLLVNFTLLQIGIESVEEYILKSSNIFIPEMFHPYKGSLLAIFKTQCLM